MIQTLSFSWYDYILFCGMLAVCSFIGIYFGCFGTKQSTAKEYLLGSKKMKVIPVAISLVASHISGITLLAVPADIYRYGATYWWAACASYIVALCTAYVFLPVFYNLQITSTYEYLERRFDSRIRMVASFLFALGVFLYLPIVIYIPALAFSAATGVNVHYVASIVCGICIFYTTLGGLKAVVWTDTLQFTITIGAIITVITIGIKNAGGIAPIFNTAVQGDRLNILDFDIDPTKRDSFWIVMIGVSMSWLANAGVHQSCIQKYLSVSSLREAKLTVLYFTIGVSIIHTFSVATGLIMYAKYAECDPFTAKIIEKNDQLLPIYVMDEASSIPGLSGLFIAGICCAALSTLSASLNCLAGTIYEDFILKIFPHAKKDKTASIILRLIVVISGVICTVFILFIEHLGSILPIALSLGGITSGPLLGMFILGVLFPKASSRGTFYGSIIGLLVVGWICFTTQYYKAHGKILDTPKPTSIAGCVNHTIMSSFLINDSHNLSSSPFKSQGVHLKTSTNNFQHNLTDIQSEPDDSMFLFRISFLYYTLLGTLITVILGLILSYALENKDPQVNKNLLSPVIHSWISDNELEGERSYSLNQL